MSFRTVTASPADVSLYHIALRELGTPAIGGRSRKLTDWMTRCSTA